MVFFFFFFKFCKETWESHANLLKFTGAYKLFVWYSGKWEITKFGCYTMSNIYISLADDSILMVILKFCLFPMKLA